MTSGLTKQFFDLEGNEVKLHDTEDKDWWLAFGESKERAFLEFCKKKDLLQGIAPNPEREEKGRKGAPEFIYQGCHLDLKVQRQPFFESQKRFGIPPRYAVTLNWRDVNDVRVKYPECLVVYWVSWAAVQYVKKQERKTMPPRTIVEIAIDPLHGVWQMEPSLMFQLEDDAIKKGNHHWYTRRFGDKKGNAPSSYVIDIRQLELVWFDKSVPPLESIQD